METNHEKITDIQLVFGFIIVLYIIHLFNICFSPLRGIYSYIGDVIYWYGYGYGRGRTEIPRPKVNFNINDFITISGGLIIVLFYFFII